jgi:hypothetical protein
VKPTLIVVAFALAAVPASAQEPPLLLPDTQGPPPATTAPAPSAPQTRGVIQMTPEQMQRIYHIRQFEGLLTNAVKAGASTLAFQMQIAEPSLFVTSNPRTRGFELEGFGVFFDVDVPAMLQSALQTRQDLQQYYNSLRATVADLKASPGLRRVAESEMRKVERNLGIQSAPPLAPPGTVSALTIDASAGADAKTASPPVTPLPDLRDPNERYTDAIKDKLIDAMLSYGSALRLGDQEWLVIGARATSDALPGQLDDQASILLRIKGADLNAYIQQKLTRDEVIKKIEIKIG